MSTYFKDFPNDEGFFGPYGGMFVPDNLKAEMRKIADAYYRISKSHDFISELRQIRKHFQGRPTPVYLDLKESGQISSLPCSVR